MPADVFGGVFRGDDGDDLEVGEVGPVDDPVLQQAGVVALHQLEAAVEIGLDPAADIGEPVGRHAALVAEAGVDGLGVAALEALDDHEQHVP